MAGVVGTSRVSTSRSRRCFRRTWTGATSEAERALVERHLASCADCTRNLATLQATVAAVREMPRVRAPRSFALPRSMAKQPQPLPGCIRCCARRRPWPPFCLSLSSPVICSSLHAVFHFAPMAAPAALPSTSIAMQAAARRCRNPRRRWPASNVAALRCNLLPHPRRKRLRHLLL